LSQTNFCVAGLFSPIFLFRLYSVDQMNLEHDDGLSAQVSPEFVFSLQPAFLIYYRHVYREVLLRLLQVFSIVDNYLWVIHRRQNPNRLTSAEFQGVFPELIG